MKNEVKLYYALNALYSVRNTIDNCINLIFNSRNAVSISQKHSFLFNIIIMSCCDYYQLSIDKFLSNSREGDLPKARHIYSKICRDIYESGLKNKITLAMIGKFINKDHASVLHGIKNVEKSKKIKGDLYYDYLQIKNNVDEIIIKQTKIYKLINAPPKPDQPSLKNDDHIYVKCHKCKGEKYLLGNICSFCFGTGKIPKTNKDEFEDFINELENLEYEKTKYNI